MATTQPVSPPFASGDKTRTNCYVEVDGQLKEASWQYKRGDHVFPDFTDTRPEFEVVIRDVHISDTSHALWKSSRLLGYGSDACVRLADVSAYPVIKLAHPRPECRRRMQQEFEVMQRLSHLSLVACTDPEPLSDEEGVFGFRMELLEKVTIAETTFRKNEIRALLAELHQAGYCHGDVHFCKIMKRSDGELVLIDFAYAGALGEAVPDHMPKYMHSSRVYSVEVDLESMERRT